MANTTHASSGWDLQHNEVYTVHTVPKSWVRGTASTQHSTHVPNGSYGTYSPTPRLEMRTRYVGMGCPCDQARSGGTRGKYSVGRSKNCSAAAGSSLDSATGQYRIVRDSLYLYWTVNRTATVRTVVHTPMYSMCSQYLNSTKLQHSTPTHLTIGPYLHTEHTVHAESAVLYVYCTVLYRTVRRRRGVLPSAIASR